MALQTEELARDMAQVNFRAESALDKALTQLAEGNGLTKSETARLLVRRGIKALVDEPAPTQPVRAAPLTRRQETDVLTVLAWLTDRFGAELDKLPAKTAHRFVKTFTAELDEWADAALLRTRKEA